MRGYLSIVALLTALAAPTAAQMDYQPPPDLEPLNRTYDKFLDAHARDGIFSYREIRLDRATLDRYVESLGSPAVAAALPTWDKPRQIAFWINADSPVKCNAATRQTTSR